VALEAIKSDLSMAEMVKKFDVHSNQITEWKKQLLNGAVDVFGKGARKAEQSEETVQSLHAKIGQLTMENDFSYGHFSQPRHTCTSPVRRSLSPWSDHFSNAANGLVFDDGSSSYPRIGYRITSFRRRAASLLDRGSRQAPCPQKNLEDSPHRARGRVTKMIGMFC
jgi:transposase